jgi:hypothetical protein
MVCVWCMSTSGGMLQIYVWALVERCFEGRFYMHLMIASVGLKVGPIKGTIRATCSSD